ncbi:MAG: hypothetical protein ACTJGR_08710 [Pauljensenia sp.]
MTERRRITWQVIGAVGASASVALLLDLAGVLRNGFLFGFLNILVLLLALVLGTWWGRRLRMRERGGAGKRSGDAQQESPAPGPRDHG